MGNRKPGDPATEWRRSSPDIVVYIPRGGERNDTDNEHFLVFEAPSREEMLAVWTQSSCEGRGDNHLVLARSADGVHWSEPRFLAGTRADGTGKQASWGFPVVSRSGRIYCFFTREVDRFDNSRQGSGTMGCLLSDDAGHSWRDAGDIPMPRSRHDHPDAAIPKNWIAWQKPIRDHSGRWLVGYTLCTSNAALADPPAGWWHTDSRCYFMRFENIDEGPEPGDLRIRWLPDDDAGLEVPMPMRPGLAAAQEPSLVLLPDGRLFCTMRTLTGFVWYSVSEDGGVHWRPPEVLRTRDNGPGIEHPLSCCPVYPLSTGQFLLLFHNNNGRAFGHDQSELDWQTNHLDHIRHPTFISVGTFVADGHQPIWFGEPYELLDTDGVPVGPKNTSEIATYTSMTEWRGTRVLWYPDRKYYLLGKLLPDDLLARAGAGNARTGSSSSHTPKRA